MQSQKAKNTMQVKKQKDFKAMKARVGSRIDNNMNITKGKEKQENDQFATASFN